MIIDVTFYKIISDAPKLLADDDVGQAVGYQRTLTCYVDANPAPSIEADTNQLYWQRNNERVQPSDRLSLACDAVVTCFQQVV